MKHPLVDTFRESKLIAIIREVDRRDIVETVAALLAGGISCVEVTFDHTGSAGIRNTLDCLDAIRERFAEQVILGAGTVLSPGEVELAEKHNARFIISPNTDPAVIRTAKEAGMLSMPGALTPSEITSAYEAGADIVKLYPIDILGVGYVKAVKGPLKHIPMSAVGGITPGNVREFLDSGALCVGIGGNLVNCRLTENKKFLEIQLQAKAFCDKIKQAY
ncbi:bifunctional 4-hydroxy-2-oxoglutarate aldolase/2-dehydro-3-deoxy-phosphogluconate aldolase [Diplocloster agilis]|uniref:Bifunctional 4-hydroxy-2-oxoglutarate aldolase/2-dehydro-3-deoxy-phosphogluconate aldolase n=1 Tax=Diplocloster agilis TaxID=2850323 RepID=A0A949JYE4_9FIRM|nr:bifunctional 4-hydroxy-2-oxoglutarate aldolase/2-dehydro-3-deoxy-phosphogluconate aldolase [Diplocloster agilis]MBU9737498.1 bifunctional 4-hydroxy-2-oxoglutarate aldolase/2-dehydro-3-deoxy-phosphogluconate aldolase [Diplocloster agilis]